MYLLKKYYVILFIMQQVTLLYDKGAQWEVDYINLLMEKCNVKKISVSIPELITMNDESIINNNILVFSVSECPNQCPFNVIYQIVLKIKPLIIIQLSEEWGGREEYMKLADHTKLYIRQYNNKDYPINKPNTIQLPLGYMSKMFKSNPLKNRLKPINERLLIWSFIGRIKSDRQELIDKFKEFNTNYIVNNNILPIKMAKIYEESIFVPNGRGNVTLDCFRLYEAVLCGAIPIVVGNEEEINITFCYNNNKPPFIYESSWDNAVTKCKYLLENKDKLKETQDNIFRWLKDYLEELQIKIKNILEPTSTR